MTPPPPPPSSPPFTIQRLCELLVFPCKHYNRTDKYLRALERVGGWLWGRAATIPACLLRQSPDVLWHCTFQTFVAGMPCIVTAWFGEAQVTYHHLSLCVRVV